jgi:hypothetical protein
LARTNSTDFNAEVHILRKLNQQVFQRGWGFLNIFITGSIAVGARGASDSFLDIGAMFLLACQGCRTTSIAIGFDAQVSQIRYKA